MAEKPKDCGNGCKVFSFLDFSNAVSFARWLLKNNITNPNIKKISCEVKRRRPEFVRNMNSALIGQGLSVALKNG